MIRDFAHRCILCILGGGGIFTRLFVIYLSPSLSFCCHWGAVLAKPAAFRRTYLRRASNPGYTIDERQALCPQVLNKLSCIAGVFRSFLYHIIMVRWNASKNCLAVKHGPHYRHFFSPFFGDIKPRVILFDSEIHFLLSTSPSSTTPKPPPVSCCSGHLYFGILGKIPLKQTVEIVSHEREQAPKRLVDLTAVPSLAVSPP